MDISNIETREKLAEYFTELGFKKGAEIGVEQGEYTEVLCKAGLEVYAIDAWKVHRGYRDHTNKNKLDGFYESTKKRLAPYNCHVIKAFSMDAIKQFENESLDFVYIDCNHTFRYVAEDIYEWSRKVRKGGIVAGHDYKFFSGKYGLYSCHVKYVVDAWVKANNIELFTTKERIPSWFYIKHFYQNIDGWSTYEDQGKLLEFILSELDTKNKLNIAEIGVYKGKCTAMWNVILSNLKIKYDYYAIDHFLGSTEHDKNIDYYSESLINLDSIIDKIHLIKNDSVSQSKFYPDKYFDIVYIDASHEYEEVKKDIIYWLPKVKNGGYLCGDDYFHDFPGVKKAVNEIFGDKVKKFGKRQWLIKK